MKKVFFFLLSVLVLTVPASALETDELEQALPESAREILGELTVADTLNGGLFQRIWTWECGQFKSRLTEASRSACVVLAVTLLCSVAGAVSQDGKTPDYVILGGALVVLGACAGDIRSFLSQVQQALSEISDFSRALLPCIASASAAAGHAASGAARYAASALFLDVLMTVGNNLILPLIYGYAAVSTANAALPVGALSGPVKLMRWLCGTLLTALTTVFTLCLSLAGVLSGSADKLAGSLTKSALSAFLPVVGSILSDAAEAYLAGAQVLRGAVGAFGLAAVLCICAGPFLNIGLHYVLFKAAACVAEPFAEGRLSKLVGNIGTAYGMALGLLGSAGVMLFVSIVMGTEAMTV